MIHWLPSRRADSAMDYKTAAKTAPGSLVSTKAHGPVMICGDLGRGGSLAFRDLQLSNVTDSPQFGEDEFWVFTQEVESILLPPTPDITALIHLGNPHLAFQIALSRLEPTKTA